MLSPDGERVAFSWNGREEGWFHVYVVSLSTRTSVKLTYGEADNLSPVWSPDGKAYCFFRVSREGGGIYVTSASGGAEKQIADVYAARLEILGRQLDWSPDGESLVVVDKESPEQPFSLFSISIKTGARIGLLTLPQLQWATVSLLFRPMAKASHSYAQATSVSKTFM